MGLDQYAYFVKKQDAINDFKFDRHYGKDDDFYWRKNRFLHGWMKELYREKGGTEEFNCQEVRLTLDDLDRLEKVIRKRSFKDVRGFFWGNDRNYTDDMAVYDLWFVHEARLHIENGGAVYYSSWW